MYALGSEKLCHRQTFYHSLRKGLLFSKFLLLIWTFFVAVAVKVIPYFDWI